MPANSTLADSITSCSKSLKLLKDLERQLAQVNAQANADLRDAKTERDNAIKQSCASQVELEAEKQVVVRYKSSLIQAERTIEEQTGVISRLHREVNHWKEQARNWQEHFTRVEEERCSLATRLDEMLAEQSQTYGPLISTHLFPGIETPISASIIKQSLTPGSLSNTKNRTLNKSNAQPNSVDTASRAPASPRKPRVANSRTNLISSSTHPSSGKKDNSTPDVPPYRLVRRVQAVVHVKSEEEDNAELHSEGSSANDGNYVVSRARKPKQGVESNRRKKTTHANESLPSSDVPPTSDGKDKSDNDEDDELLMEDSRQSNILVASNNNPPTKKRKLNTSTRQKLPKKD